MTKAERKNTVVMSDCGKFRYSLHAKAKNYLNAKKPKNMIFIMINPSTADDSNDDRTIESCKRIAMHHECSDLYVLNLFPYRTKSVKELTEFLSTASPEVLQKMRSDNIYHQDSVGKRKQSARYARARARIGGDFRAV